MPFLLSAVTTFLVYLHPVCGRNYTGKYLQKIAYLVLSSHQEFLE